MKQTIFAFLLFAVTYLSSCKIDPLLPDVRQLDKVGPVTVPAPSNQDTVNVSITGHLQLQLARDPVNTDNVLIDFDPNSKPTFVKNEDAPTLQGFGLVSLSSLSSDNVALAINTMPLSNQPLTIGLVVNAKTDGVYKLNMLTISAIPQMFEVWLMDSYKKDSLDFRQNASYSFDLVEADTNSYGSHRFSLVIREDALLGVHLLSFKAVKTAAGTKCTWVAENEQNYTNFSVERSTDNGQTYNSMTAFMSSAAATYSFVDKNPVNGSDKYRLKLKDINGAISYSTVVSLNY